MRRCRCSICYGVQTIVSRRLSPFETGVITIGSFDGKGQFNVIKDAVELEGDVRALTDDIHQNSQLMNHQC